ncbi:MAG: ABC transporter substrate-binding protein [Christensenellales bacterium]|jgi:multiple sugar transport system substrate-binding protein
MKKLVCLLIALVMLLAMFPAFAEEQTDVRNLIGDGANTISIAFSGEEFNEEALFKVLQEFYEETGISVEVLYVASSGGWAGFFSKIQTMIAGGDTPDLIRIAIEGFQIFYSNDMIVPLNEYAEKYPEFAAMVNDNHEKLVAPFTVDGQQYGYGFDWNNVLAHINTDILAECGLEMPEPEWTVEEFLDYAQKMTFTREDGTKVWGTQVPNYYFGTSAWLFNWGASILNEDMTESTINSPEAVEMFQFLHDLIYVYEVAPDPTTVGSEFITGQVAMQWGGRWLLGSYYNNDFFNVDVAYVPIKATNQVISGVGIYPISKASEHKDEAYKLACWLSTADAQSRILARSHIPSSKTCLEAVRNAEFPKHSYLFADSADVAKSVECPAAYSELQEIFDRYTSLIFADEMPVQEALDACKAEMDMALMDY